MEHRCSGMCGIGAAARIKGCAACIKADGNGERRCQSGEEETRRQTWLQIVDGVGRKSWRLEARRSRQVLHLKEEPWRVGPVVMRRAG
jgi:hypothetical protein